MPLRRRRNIALAAVIAALVCAAATTAARLNVRPSTLDVYRKAFVQPAVAPSDVDIVPVSLEKRSNGEPVTVFVTLPPPWNPAEVDVASMLLCLGSGPCTGGASKPQYIGREGRTLKVVFARSDVIEVVSGVPGHTVVSLTVSGLLHFPAAFFYGSDQVQVLD